MKNISNNKTLNKNDILKVINFDIDKLNSNDRLGIKNLLNKYINKIIVDYPNLEIHFKFTSNIGCIILVGVVKYLNIFLIK